MLEQAQRTNTGRDLEIEGQGKSDFVAKAWQESVMNLYGCFGWQLEVGTNYNATIIYDDAATWNKLYEHINVINVILDQIQDLPHDTEQIEADY